jgi:hypothetical protein
MRLKESSDVVGAASVLAAEKIQIDGRRAQVAPNAPDGLVGLAFSGGGIRSATLNLGILQGLAARHLLPYFDYLSTVSGGGYIGAWLHGVIQRYGKGDPTAVLPLLRRPDEGMPKDSEHDPIAFLRKFSSYLAPDTSLFGADVWVIVGIWLRNMGLNLTIVFPFAAAIALLLFGIEYAGQWANWPAEFIAAICAVLLLSVVAVVGDGVRRTVRKADVMAAKREGHRPPEARRPRKDRISIGVISTSLMMLVSVLFACASPALHANAILAPMTAVLLILFAALQYEGGFLDCYVARHHGNKSGGVWLLALFSVISAVVTSGLLDGAMHWIRTWPADAQATWRILAFGPPLVMLAMLIGVGLVIGLMGVDFPDFGREWLSRIGAFLTIGTVAWLALYSIVVFGPYWITWLTAHYQKTGWGIISGWIMTTLGGVLSGNSGKTDGNPKNKSNVLDWIAQIAPPIFMAGFLMLASTAAHAGIARATGFSGSFLDNYWCVLNAPRSPLMTAALLAACIAMMMFMQWRVNINEFSMAHFYKNRLVRCYLGASRGIHRRGSRLTGFDPRDDLPIVSLIPDCEYYGPYAIVNTTINLNTGSELAKRERHATSFIFTPLYTGYAPPRAAELVVFSEAEGAEPKGYRLTHGYAEPDGPQIGTCTAISGAAANPDMGFHTSAPVAFLLTVFDVRLGWWFGNTRFDEPSARPGPPFALRPLLSELFAQTDSESQFVNLSDGGHFENLGIYELIRRRCRYIIACDGEQDNDYTFTSLGGAVRKCRADFGVEIDIDPKRIRLKKKWSTTHCVVGRIRYPDAPPGWLLYLKSSLTGDEPEDVMQYKASHGDFPQETTADQFFTEDQFESYRRLGLHIVESAFENVTVAPGSDPHWMENLFRCLWEQWYPPSEVADGLSSRHAETYSALLRRLSADPDLRFLDTQIFRGAGPQPAPSPEAERKAFYFCVDLIQLMENVWSDLRFFETANRDNPKNQGWITVFRDWSRQPAFQEAWKRSSYTYNPLFQQFYNWL